MQLKSTYGQAGIAQLVEHFTRNEGVASSSLAPGLKNGQANLSACPLFVTIFSSLKFCLLCFFGPSKQGVINL